VGGGIEGGGEKASGILKKVSKQTLLYVVIEKLRCLVVREISIKVVMTEKRGVVWG